MEYRNKRTGNVMHVPCPIYGEDWEEVKAEKPKTPKKTTKKKTTKKEK